MNYKSWNIKQAIRIQLTIHLMQFRINMVVVKMRWSFDILTWIKIVAQRPRESLRRAVVRTHYHCNVRVYVSV